MSSSPLDVLGWVPVDMGWDSQDTLSGIRRIAWMDCGGVTFTEPFFLQTVARLRTPSERRTVVTTALEAIVSRFGPSFHFNPAGLIFHVSRCGSTALANCLKLCERTKLFLSTGHCPNFIGTVYYQRLAGSVSRSSFWTCLRSRQVRGAWPRVVVAKKKISS